MTRKTGLARKGTGKTSSRYGGPGGPRLEFIPAYNWEVIVAAPPWATASGPRGNAEGWGDWPAFLVKYRLLSANKDNGDYIVTAFFQMSDPLGTPGTNFKQRSDRPADARVWQRVGRLRYSIDGQCANSGRRDRFGKLHGLAEYDEVR